MRQGSQVLGHPQLVANQMREVVAHNRPQLSTNCRLDRYILIPFDRTQCFRSCPAHADYLPPPGTTFGAEHAPGSHAEGDPTRSDQAAALDALRKRRGMPNLAQRRHLKSQNRFCWRLTAVKRRQCRIRSSE
jgi:hypothetical protein